MANSPGNLTYNLDNFSDYDTYLFKNGNHFKLYEKLGAHPMILNGIEGTCFAVWAPNAKNVSLVGDFNYWDKNANPMGARWDNSGIWETFIPQVKKGSLYKFHITSKLRKPEIEKCDPFAFFCELPPETASIVWDLGYRWNDEKWIKNRHKNNNLNCPLSIYEVHLGSWKRIAEENNRSLNYREIAESLSDYIKKMGFTHVELMPLMEHPFYGSWGYQVTGYFSPTSRYGNPQDFMFLVDCLHQNGIGVILDWVPSHFPDDPHGLARFDGSFLYEYQDPKKGFHPDWKSLVFNYNRNEVKEFLISNALFWLEKYHMDGLRVDAVASMLYLDYSRKTGEWIPNRFGGRENLEAIDFIKQLNETVYREFPDVQTIAEESTAWPAVTKPVHDGGLGFGMKWNMGWMHDTLNYFSRNTIYRKFHQNELTFTFEYAFTENFILPLSHDEIVYEKKSLLEKMPGDRLQKFANLRLLLAYMYGFPGKKLLFMGDELGQLKEWNHEESIRWELLGDDMHRGLQKLVIELNKLYTIEGALYNSDFANECFEWVDFGDNKQSVLSFIRKVKTKENQNTIVVACNFTPTPRYNYRIGVPYPGIWKEIFNSDAKEYGGSGHGNLGKVNAKKKESHSRPFSISITLPPLSVVFFKKNSHKPIRDN